MDVPEQRWRELDGLRGIAVLLVVVSHYYVLVDIAGAWRLNYALKHLLAYSGTGVDLFFVLSGFLVGGILLDRRATPNLLPVFFVRRACRILPPYLLLLASFVIAAQTLPVSADNAYLLFDPSIPLWSYFLFLQNIIGPFFATIGPWWLAVTWSLAVEVHFYGIFPFVSRHAAPRWLIGCAALVALGSPVARTITTNWLELPHAASYTTFLRLDGLVLGALLAGLWRRPSFAAAALQHRGILRTLALGGIGASMLLPFTAIGANESFIICAVPSLASLLWTLVLALALVSRGHNVFGQCLRQPLLTGAGAISYFVYLFHLPVHYVVHQLLFGRFPVHLSVRELAATGLAFAIVIGLGCLSFVSVEQFMIRVGRRSRYQTT